MKESPSIWAIIPTRGGSDGLSKKNIRTLFGKPLLHYMVEAAISSRRLTKVTLTTDDDEIEHLASQISGLQVLRHDPALSRAGQPSFGVFQSTLKKLIDLGDSPPLMVLLLRVTTPLCLPEDIDECVLTLISKMNSATSAISVTKSDIHPKRLCILTQDGLLRAREETPETHFPHPRQEFEPCYVRNGAIYATFPNVVFTGSLWGDKSLPYVMPKDRSININDETDFILAEELLKRRK
jgi:CMP-N,N'-diacetyllegionaminic acid synthase